ncbi:citrate lyase subunit gamma [Candidatus Allofournierella excrementavium]|uniref:citrate lyase subunit gamma n=1 Tax=Candidatus Allofournierella excrementavium TaxID=2838591 RepID=UPI001F9AE6C2|nr:citrate lyase acyl carrier protein [Candidatus Fournierella merdigallinarum]
MRERSCAGLQKNDDIYIELARMEDTDEIEIVLCSKVQQLYGRQICATLKEALLAQGITGVRVTADDRGALDFVVRARAETAAMRMKEEGEKDA